MVARTVDDELHLFWRETTGGRRYVVRYRELTQQRRRHSVRVHPVNDLDAARAARDDVIRRRDSGEPLITSQRQLAVYIADWHDWLDDRESYQVMSNNAADYRQLVEKWVRPLLGDCRLCELLPYLLAWFNDQVAEGSRPQVRKHLQKIVQFAVDEGEIEFNPIVAYYPGRQRRRGPAAER